MSMMSLIAVLVSFAMMLTGAGGEGQPTEASRMLTLRNVSITYGDQTVDLAPALNLGAATDGEKAVYSFGVDLNGETLLPIQLGVDEAGLTALFQKSDVAVNVTADAINAAMEQAAQLMNDMSASVEVENPEVLDFLTNEFLPAYAGLIEAAQDEEFVERLQARGEAIFDELIDRGEGTPSTIEIEGETYDVAAYSYVIESEQLGALSDALFASDEKLSAYADALFKLYGMLPEESGLNGLTSFSDLLDKTGMEIAMEVQEQRSDDGEIDVENAVITVDMTGMIARMAEAEAAQEDGEAAEAEIPEVAPIVMYVAAAKVGEASNVTLTCTYAVEEVGFDMALSGDADETSKTAAMSMNIFDEDVALGGMTVYVSDVKGEAGGSAYSASFHMDAADEFDFNFGVTGEEAADGTSENHVEIFGEADGKTFALSFDLDVTDAAIEDAANGHEAYVIDELSEEALEALGEDEGFAANLMQVIGSLSADAQKLAADESVQALMGLGAEAAEDVYDYGDDADSFDSDYDDEDYDYDGYDEIEDDGVLSFEQPEFGWLPEGWTVVDTNVDTAYDYVDVVLSSGEDENSAYAMFLEDYSDAQTGNYIVAEDGSIAPVTGREVTISDYGDGTLSVSVSEAGVYASMTFDSETVDLDTIGRIIAGIQF